MEEQDHLFSTANMCCKTNMRKAGKKVLYYMFKETARRTHCSFLPWRLRISWTPHPRNYCSWISGEEKNNKITSWFYYKTKWHRFDTLIKVLALFLFSLPLNRTFPLKPGLFLRTRAFFPNLNTLWILYTLSYPAHSTALHNQPPHNTQLVLTFLFSTARKTVCQMLTDDVFLPLKAVSCMKCCINELLKAFFK